MWYFLFKLSSIKTLFHFSYPYCSIIIFESWQSLTYKSDNIIPMNFGRLHNFRFATTPNRAILHGSTLTCLFKDRKGASTKQWFHACEKFLNMESGLIRIYIFSKASNNKVVQNLYFFFYKTKSILLVKQTKGKVCRLWLKLLFIIIDNPNGCD